MRLLDRVAQSRAPLLVAHDGNPHSAIRVTGPADYAAAVATCPLRYVLGDDLTRTAAELAFADGDRLASCLDLLRIPASPLWIEWNDAVHQQVLFDSGSSVTPPAGAAGRRVGLFLTSSRCGRTGLIRTFWSDDAADDEAEITLSPLETHVDLRDPSGADGLERPAMDGGFIGVADAADAGVNALLECARFRFDERWSGYYSRAAATPPHQKAVLNASLAAVVRDVPLLFAFFLLLNARDATRSVSVDRGILNQKRLKAGRSPLLDHIEIRASLGELPTSQDEEGSGRLRRPSRLHHVRGHLVRRGLSVFWRSPHVRGRATLGTVRTRTVCLTFERSGVTRSSRELSSGAAL